MEDDATQHGQPVNTPEAIAERLRALEEEAATLRAALSEATPSPRHDGIPGDGESGSPHPPTLSPQHDGIRGEGEPEVASPESTIQSPEPPLDQATHDKIEKLLQRYRLEGARGNREIGSQYLKEAQQLAPGASVVLEVLGDDAVERRQMKDGIDFYRRAKEANPRNASADKKHADLVFKTQAALASAGLSQFESVASARSASFLSVIVPGLGHMVTGQIPKGITYLLLWVGSVVWVVLTPKGVEGIIAMMSNRSEPKLNMMIFVPIFIGLITWLSSMIDMNTRSKGLSRTLGKGDGPKPPVDLPF